MYASLLSIGFILIYHLIVSSNSGYVIIDNTKIYDGFKMKIHYQKEIENRMLTERNILDSMRIELKILHLKSQNNPNDKTLAKEVEIKNNELNVFQVRAKANAEELAEKYENQIWSQINQYVREYGKKNKFKMIFGAAGDGSIMYVDENADYTNVVLNYINEKYESGE